MKKNNLLLQTATLKKESLNITIDSIEHINPIIYSSRAAYISKEVASFNSINLNKIEVGQIVRGAKINSISYRASDLNMKERYPDILIKRHSILKDSIDKDYLDHDFLPKAKFPNFFYSLSPDIRTHVGSPQRFIYTGFGLKFSSEIQMNRNIVIRSIIGQTIDHNFDEKNSVPNSSLPHVRTEVLDYLRESSKELHIKNLEIESIFSPKNNIWTKLTFGYLEDMYGGMASEFLFKPYRSDLAASLEYNYIKRRAFEQKFSFIDYQTTTYHLNLAYYEPRSNILAKWSYGKYLAGDTGYTLDLSRRMPSGWRAGFFFTRTNVSAEQFGEGSFDKGFYFSVPLNIFSKGYSKESNGFSLKTMTRDGGQKLELKNRLIDSFYGSTFNEINENWSNFLD